MTERSAILDSLDKILKHSAFASSQQLSSFLRYVVNQKLDGNEDRLKAYTIAVDALDRPENFNPQIDPIVRVLAGRLRHGLELYYEGEGARDAVKISIPKGSYRPHFLEEPQVQGGVVGAFLKKNGARHLWLYSSIAMLAFVAIAVFFRVQNVNKIAEEVSRAPLLAIAEFDGNFDDADMEKFVYGLRFDLISELSRFSWLSTFAHKSDADGGPKPLWGKGHRAADYILYGSVNTINDRFHMSFRLESADTGIVRWAQVFEREFTAKNIYEIQKEAVTAIAVKIGSPDGVVRRIEQGRYQHRIGGLSAYACTLRSYHYWNTFNPKDHLESRDCLEQAVKTDPLYADAHAALAYMYLDEYLYNFNVREGYDSVKRALKSAQHAVKLDKFSTLSKQALFAATLYDGNVEGFIRIGMEAIKFSPNNPGLLADFGMKMSLNAGLWEEGAQYSKKALQLNSEPSRWYFLSSVLGAINEERFQKALNWDEKMNAPDWIISHLIKVVALAGLNDLPLTQDAMKLLKSRGVSDAKSAAKHIKGFHFHPEFEAFMIYHLRSAFEFAKGTS
ncbi:MAG: hypothetical protein JKX91_01495 [Rhizobiaceae bacterium]|nr:hypothetical protein [Rhizobiaceae bacterium]